MPHKLRELFPPKAKSPKCYGPKLRALFESQVNQRGFEDIKKAIQALEAKLPTDYPVAATRVGIEVEVENVPLDRVQHVPLPWIVKGDGSLRNNGAEFISVPILPQDVSLAVASLYGFFKGIRAAPDFSWRTSTHIHLEANQMTVAEFKNFVLLYLIFEDSLFQFSNPGRRETNIYCTPLSRTDYQILRALLQADDELGFTRVMSDLPRRIFKYSALNLSHIFGYGTVEFRHLGGEKTPAKVCNWLRLLLKLFEASSRLSRKDIEQNVLELNTNSFYRHFLSEVFGNLSPFLETDERDLFLSNGVMVCKEILAAGPPVQQLDKGEKNGLMVFGEAEAKKQVSDPLEEKKKSLEINEIQDEEAQEVADPENPGLFRIVNGRRYYAPTYEGLSAAKRWWNPHAIQNRTDWLFWRAGEPDYQGYDTEARRWENNSHPAHVFTPI